MLFNSYLFLFVFLPLVLAGWYWLNFRGYGKLAQGYLIGMSLWFYGYLNLFYLLAFAGSCAAGYLLCFLMERFPAAVLRRMVLAAGCAFHLGLLGYFKYANFFLENFNAFFRTDLALVSVLMPVGISFYTFQQLAFLIDCYKGEEKCPPFLDYLLFQVYFPQLLQGPILLGRELLPQLAERERRFFCAPRFLEGMRRFGIGLAKKALLADALAKAVDFGYANVGMLDSLSALFLAAGYLTELYFDFSGYCDMAVGLGKMIGLEVCENFDSPFHSASVKEFWRRWHMTLGRFLTRYVYIPLGGSRKGKGRTVLNTLVVFAVSGLWHGASWNFVFWGLLHGIGVAWDSFGLLRLPGKRARQALTFAYVSLVFVFFRSETIGEGFRVLRALFSLRWNGFFFRIAEALELPETYLVTKALSMKAPALLPWANLLFLLLFLAVCAAVLVRKNAAARVKETEMTVPRALALAALFAWSVLSFTGVGTYLYFSF